MNGIIIISLYINDSWIMDTEVFSDFSEKRNKTIL